MENKKCAQTINISVFFWLNVQSKRVWVDFFKYVGEVVQLTNAGTVEREDSRNVAPPPKRPSRPPCSHQNDHRKEHSWGMFMDKIWL